MNGSLAGESSVPSEKSKVESYYSVKAIFSAGDVVRVEAESGEGICVVEQTVPAAPELLGASLGDDVELSYNDYGNARTTTFRKIYLRLSDRAGQQNYYRVHVNAGGEEECTRGLLPDSREGRKIVYDTERQDILNLLEPVLKVPFATANPVNDFNIFSDESFEGEQYSLTLCWKYLSSKVMMSRPSIFGVYDPDTQDVISEEWIQRIWLSVVLEALPVDAYRYYMAVEYESNNNVIPLAYEPAVFPSNVEGGLGYVSISSASSRKISLPDRYFD